MIPARRLAACLAAILSVACGSKRSRRPPTPPADPTVTLRWYATLAAQGDSAGAERGSAVVQPGVPLPGTPATELLAFVSVRRLPPGTTVRWRVQQGPCGTPGAVVGSPAAYPAMRVLADGMAGAQATLAAAPPAGGAHSVWVADSTDRVLACGDLRLTR